VAAAWKSENNKGESGPLSEGGGKELTVLILERGGGKGGARVKESSVRGKPHLGD